jgi:hypothetical protein
MALKKIKQDNIIRNVLVTYPKVSFNIFSGSIYSNIENSNNVPPSKGLAALEDFVSGSN